MAVEYGGTIEVDAKKGRRRASRFWPFFYLVWYWDGMEEMKAGRELDYLVVERVMGWRRIDAISFSQPLPSGLGYQRLLHEVPEYSTSIEAAWEVVEWMAAQKRDGFGWFDLRFSNDCYQATFFTGAYYEATDHIQGKSAPHAICLAALKAVGAYPIHPDPPRA